MKAKQNVEKPAIKMRKTVLDGLDWGTDAFVESHSDKKTRAQLPDHVSSKSVYKDIINLAWPTFIELMLASLTSMVDMMMVGNLGASAISSVSMATQPKFILMTVFQSMCTGSTALVARCRGANDPERANHFMRQSLALTLFLASVSTVLGLVFIEPLIKIMGKAEPEVFAGTVSYLRIQIYSLIPMALTFCITAVLRGVGKTRASMVYNLIANVVNVVFNYLLIEGHFGFPRMEVAGASLATAIGQVVAFVIAIIVITRPHNYLQIHLRDSFKPDIASLKEIAKIGFPAMLENVIMRVGVIIFTRTVVGLGTVKFATHNVCMNINSMSFMTGNAFANAATSLMGQSLGKKRPDMGEVYVKYTRRLGLCFAGLLIVLFSCFGGFIVSLYNDDPEIIETGRIIMLFVAFLQPFQNSQFITAGSLRGAGDTKSIAKIIMITTVGVRAGLALLLVNVLHLGLYGAWTAMVLDQLLRSVLVIHRYNSGKWKKIRVNIHASSKDVSSEPDPNDDEAAAELENEYVPDLLSAEIEDVQTEDPSTTAQAIK